MLATTINVIPKTIETTVPASSAVVKDMLNSFPGSVLEVVVGITEVTLVLVLDSDIVLDGIGSAPEVASSETTDAVSVIDVLPLLDDDPIVGNSLAIVDGSIELELKLESRSSALEGSSMLPSSSM
jgi:hypothetical protein